MAQDKDSVTPEEKLLNVIQKGGEPQPAAKESPAPAAAETAKQAAQAALKKATVKDEPAAAKPKPALKMAPRKAEPAKAPEEQAVQESAGPEPAAVAVVAAKKRVSHGSGITLINRMLAAGIAVLLGLSAFEVFSTVRARGTVKDPAQLELPAPKEVELALDEVKAAFSSDIWWRLDAITGSAGTGATTLVTTVTVSTTPWQQALNESFKLIATSRKEPKTESKAILVDTRNNKMYFVRLGESFMVEGVEVKLDDLEVDRARFTAGGASVEMK
jgi:hypothetical protein